MKSLLKSHQLCSIWWLRCLDSADHLHQDWILLNSTTTAMLSMLQPLLLLLWLWPNLPAASCIQEIHFAGKLESESLCWKDCTHLVALRAPAPKRQNPLDGFVWGHFKVTGDVKVNTKENMVDFVEPTSSCRLVLDAT